MGDNFFGVPNNMASERSSSRKMKKLDKPRQPQRGLGVAQLEQIRLRSQMTCGITPPYNSYLQEDLILQGVQSYGIPHSSSSYPYSQSSPSASSPYAHNPNFMMTFGDERSNTGCYNPYQISTPSRWSNDGNSVLDNSPYTQADLLASSQLFNQFEDSRQKMDLLRRMGSNREYSNSSDQHEEVDLELRL